MHPIIRLAEWEQLSFTHRSTTRNTVDKDGCSVGDTTWVARLGGAEILLQWEWCEVEPRVLAVANVQDVVTNAVLIDERGKEILQPVRHLFFAVYQLDWQVAVLSQLAPH